MEAMSHLLLLLVSVAAAMADPASPRKGAMSASAMKALDTDDDPAKNGMNLAEEVMKELEADDGHQKGGLAAAAMKDLETGGNHQKGWPTKGFKMEVDLGKDGSFAASVGSSTYKRGSNGKGQDDNIVVLLVPNNKMEGKVDVGDLLQKARATNRAVKKLNTHQQSHLKLSEQVQQSEADEEELKEDRELMEWLQQALRKPQKLKAGKKHRDNQPMRVRGYFPESTTDTAEAPGEPYVEASQAMDVHLQSQGETTTVVAAQEEKQTKQEKATQAPFQRASPRSKNKDRSLSDEPFACPRGQEKGPDGECAEIWSFVEFKNLGVPPF